MTDEAATGESQTAGSVIGEQQVIDQNKEAAKSVLLSEELRPLELGNTGSGLAAAQDDHQPEVAGSTVGVNSPTQSAA